MIAVHEEYIGEGFDDMLNICVTEVEMVMGKAVHFCHRLVTTKESLGEHRWCRLLRTTGTQA